MARSAADCAAILGVIAGVDPDDPTTVQAPVPDYLGSIDAGIEGMRIGLDEAYCSDGVDPRVTAMVVQGGRRAARARPPTSSRSPSPMPR